jgi:hypothetical protein
MPGKVTIDPTGSNDSGICDCCGRSSRTVWGQALTDNQCVAAYFVHWTLGHVSDRGANIDLIIGEWGEATTAEHRSAVALAYRLTEDGPSVMVIDANDRPVSRSPLIGQALRRNDVIGTPLAQNVFAIADTILAHDDRVAELLGSWTIST